MEIDGELYRKYYKALGEWKEQEAIMQVSIARKLTSQQAWERYKSLWELVVNIAADNLVYQHEEHLHYLEEYYLKVEKLSAWTHLHEEAA